MAWRKRRNLENSLLKYITDNINTDWTNVNINFSFNYNENDLPFIAVRIDSGTHPRLELGSNLLDSRPLVIIDIYANEEGQKLDLVDYLVNKLAEGFQYYKFSPNPQDKDNPTLVADGWVYTADLSDNRIDLGENVGKCDQHRHRITCLLQRNKA